MQLGSVAEWVGAIGTVGTLVAALVVLQRELKSHSHDREQRRREQARTVAVWVVGDPMPNYREYGDQVGLSVKNASSWPIYACVARLVHPIGAEVDTDGYLDHIDPTVILGVVPPGEVVSEGIDAGSVDESRIIFPGLNAEVDFTDSSGVHWRRRVDGTLEEREFMAKMC